MAYARVHPDAPRGERPAVLPLAEPFVVLGSGEMAVSDGLVPSSLSIGALAYGIARARAYARTSASEGRMARDLQADAAALEADVCSPRCAREYLDFVTRRFAHTSLTRRASSPRVHHLRRTIEGCGREPLAPPIEPTFADRVHASLRLIPRVATASQRFIEQLEKQQRLLPAASEASQRARAIHERVGGDRVRGQPAPRVLRDHELGAFTLPNGQTIVSAGLLDRLGDGAVAFVLAHELAHHELGDFRELHLEPDAISGLRASHSLALLRNGFRRGLASKELELQADERAFDRMRAAGYPAADAYQAFQQLTLERRGHASFTHPSARAREHRLRVRDAALRRESGQTSTATDHTRLCVPCQLRHAEARCPECDTPSFDLTSRLGRAGARRALARRGRQVNEGDRRRLAFLGAMAVVFGAVFALSPSRFVPFLLLLAWALGLDWLSRGGLDTLRRALAYVLALPARGVRIRLAPVAEPSTRSNIEVVGVARTDEPLIAPVSGRACIAWRIEGTGAFGAVHDAAYAPFRLESGEHGTVEVPARAATITFDVARGQTHAEALATPWLTSRTLDETLTDVTESVIAVGDAVRVRGEAKRVSAPAGYRIAGRDRIVWADERRLEIVAEG